MIVIPAIDIKDGKCVRLTQGQMHDENIYYSNPLDAAARWIGDGASRIHLVDLDGAFQGITANYEAICEIRNKFPNLILQLGGGIRSGEDAAKYLSGNHITKAIDYIILGTSAVRDPLLLEAITETYPHRVYVSCDIKDGKIYNQGWEEGEETSIKDHLNSLQQRKLAGIIVTDIKNDGMLQGLDFALFEDIAKITSLPIIVAGGITNIHDIEKLKASGNFFGVICGKSIYEGTLNLGAAIRLCL